MATVWVEWNAQQADGQMSERAYTKLWYQGVWKGQEQFSRETQLPTELHVGGQRVDLGAWFRFCQREPDVTSAFFGHVKKYINRVSTEMFSSVYSFYIFMILRTKNNNTKVDFNNFREVFILLKQCNVLSSKSGNTDYFVFAL